MFCATVVVPPNHPATGRAAGDRAAPPSASEAKKLRQGVTSGLLLNIERAPGDLADGVACSSWLSPRNSMLNEYSDPCGDVASSSSD